MTNEKNNEMAIEKPATDFNLHIGGDGVRSNVKVPRETTTFGLSILTFGLVAYLVKTYVGKAMKK